MRTYFFCMLLLIAACRRPSTRLASTLTPASQTKMPATDTTDVPDYSPYLRAGDELVAIGTEPAWSLTINPSKSLLLFKSPAGDSISVPAPQQLAESDGSFRYDVPAESGRIRVQFIPDSCVDKLSGRRFDYRVEVAIRDKNYMGCGVSLRQVSLLQDIWVLTDLQNERVKAGGIQNEAPRLEISLTEGRVSGTTGCNRLNGTVRADSRRIAFGPLMTTKMGCPDAAGQLEGNFLSALRKPLTYTLEKGKLILSRDGTAIMTFKKVD